LTKGVREPLETLIKVSWNAIIFFSPKFNAFSC
jgi:hypothetical protein